MNNAGILRDVSFAKMTEQQWDLVYEVHCKGTKSIIKAAWPYMRKQKYGRIVNTTSVNGLYGQIGQANYSLQKLALSVCRILWPKRGHGAEFMLTVLPHKRGRQ